MHGSCRMLMATITLFRNLGKEPVAMKNPCFVSVFSEVLPCRL